MGKARKEIKKPRSKKSKLKTINRLKENERVISNLKK